MKTITFTTVSGQEISVSIVGILSSSILILDGNYEAVTLKGVPDIEGLPHYVGHPTTREILENLGAVMVQSEKDPTKPANFKGLQPGEAMLAFPIQQHKLDRVSAGYTTDQSRVALEDLQVRIIYRVN